MADFPLPFSGISGNDLQNRLSGMLQIARTLNASDDPNEAMRAIIDEISKLLHADRTSIYEFDSERRMLVGLAVQGEQSSRVGILLGQGIAGRCALENHTINLKDAYKDSTFDRRFDKLTGYRTKSILCVPMQSQAQLVGVVQVLNKKEGYFTLDDEYLLTILAAQAAITLQALHLRQQLENKNKELLVNSEELAQRVRELELLSEQERTLADVKTPEELAERALQGLAQVAKCERAALMLPGQGSTATLYLRRNTADEPLQKSQIDREEGLLGFALRAKGFESFTSPSAFTEAGAPDFLSRDWNLPLRSAIVTPLRLGESELGALAFIDSQNPSERNRAQDQRFVGLIASLLSRTLDRLKRQREAQQQDRLMTIGQMMSSVMHDLRGPMTVISGYAQMMADIDDPEERADVAKSICRQVEQTNAMAREVMAFTRGETSIFPSKIYPERFVAAFQEQMASEFKACGVTLEVHVETHEPVWFDQGKILRVLTNLARNARQALKDHGRVSLTVRDLSPADQSSLNTGVVFICEDNGPGVPPEIRNKLFEAFTTAGKAEGTGLGLAIAKRIAEEHGGTIRCETETGKGTQFILTLPKDCRSAGALLPKS